MSTTNIDESEGKRMPESSKKLKERIKEIQGRSHLSQLYMRHNIPSLLPRKDPVLPSKQQEPAKQKSKRKIFAKVRAGLGLKKSALPPKSSPPGDSLATTNVLSVFNSQQKSMFPSIFGSLMETVKEKGKGEIAFDIFLEFRTNGQDTWIPMQGNKWKAEKIVLRLLGGPNKLQLTGHGKGFYFPINKRQWRATMVRTRTPVFFVDAMKDYYHWIWCLSHLQGLSKEHLPIEVLQQIGSYVGPAPMFWLEEGDLLLKERREEPRIQGRYLARPHYSTPSATVAN